MEADTKKCSECGEVKYVEQFSRDYRKGRSYHNYCKPCQKKYNAEYYILNKFN